MARIVRRMSRQEAATWAVVAALVVVVLYSLWGASVLRAEREARALNTAVVVNR